MIEHAAGVQPDFYPRALNRQVHGLRGLAALLVFVSHVFGIASEAGFWPAHYLVLSGWLLAGAHGVQVFFIISGYLIVGSVLRHADAGRFLLDRCIRIYPVFLAIQLLVFGLGPALHYKWLNGISLPAWLANFVSNALFLPGLFDLPLAQISAWSLSFEAGFYLFAAAIWLVARRLGRKAGWIVFVVGITPLLAIYINAAFFLVGAAIYFLKPRLKLAAPVWLRRLSPVLLAAMLGLMLASDNATTWARAGAFLACVPGFLFFWYIIDGECPLSAVLRSRGLQYFGTISYSFYLWSALVTYPVKLAIRAMLPGSGGSMLTVGLFALVSFGLSVAVSQVSFAWLEERAGRRLRRMLARRPAATGSAPVAVDAEGGARS